MHPQSITAPRHPGGRPPRPLAERFWEKVDQSGNCWLWLSTVYKRSQRGQFKVNGRTRKAYQVAWELTYGPIPPGLEVCHHCDNPRCVRPSHLFLDTRRGNAEDAKRKGRTPTGARNGAYTHPERRPAGARHGWALHPEAIPRGEQKTLAKLTPRTAQAIRDQRAQGATYQTLATTFGVSRACVWQVLRGQTWRSEPIAGA